MDRCTGRRDETEILLKTAEPGIEPATSCSQVLYATDWAMGLGGNGLKID